jgi:hypothetical protein
MVAHELALQGLQDGPQLLIGHRLWVGGIAAQGHIAASEVHLVSNIGKTLA